VKWFYISYTFLRPKMDLQPLPQSSGHALQQRQCMAIVVRVFDPGYDGL